MGETNKALETEAPGKWRLGAFVIFRAWGTEAGAGEMAHSGKSSAAPPSHQYPLLLEQVSFQLCHPKKHYLALRQLSDVYTGLERKPKAHP